VGRGFSGRGSGEGNWEEGVRVKVRNDGGFAGGDGDVFLPGAFDDGERDVF
jgi:hypothetical protein